MAEPLSPFVAWLHKMMQYLPHLAIIASLLVYAFFIFTERYSSIFNLSLYLIPLIGISLVLIVNKKFCCDDSAALFNISFKRLRNTHLIIFALTIICLGFGHDGWLYLALMFVQYCLLLAQLFAKDQSSKWIVAGVMLTTSILVLPQMLTPAYYCGGDGDLLFHAGYAKTIIDMGTVATGYGGVYESFCAYHILIATFAEATGLAINISLYLVSAAAVLFSVPIVYAMTKFFTKSERIGAFAAFFYVLLPITFNSLLAPAPRVMASIAFILIIHMFTKYFPYFPHRTILLSISLVFYMIFVHHAQWIFIIPVTIIIVIGAIIYSKKIGCKTILIGCGVIIIPILLLCYRYWNNLISILNNRLFNTLESGKITDVVIESPVTNNPDILTQLLSINYEYTLVCVASSVMIIYTFIGIYTLVRNITSTKKIGILIPLVICTFVIFIPGIIDIFPAFSETFQIFRIRLLLSPFFALIMAIGIIVLLNIPRKSWRKTIYTIIIGLCLCLILSSAIIYGSSSNDAFENILDDRTKPTLKEAELQLIGQLEHIIPKKETSYLYTDYEHGRYIADNQPNVNPFKKVSFHIYQLFVTPHLNPKDMTYIIIPYSKYGDVGISVRDGYTEYGETKLRIVTENEAHSKIFETNTYNHDIIYENNDTRMYYYS